MSYSLFIETKSRFIFSTSGSESSLEKHNTALKRLSVNLAYFTFSQKITGKEYAELLRSPISRGGAVTGQGLKTDILPYIDLLDNSAKIVNAVNTVVNINGVLHGYNTDALGLEKALTSHRENSRLKLRTAVVYGNGGVSGVAVYVLQKMGMKVTLTGRNREHVKEKMNLLHLKDFHGPYDLVVNATPASSYPLEEIIGFTELLDGCQAVFDHNMPEKDRKKNTIEEYCKKKKIYFIPGKDMYIPQMMAQWKLFLEGVETSSGTHPSFNEERIKNAWNIS